jgi:hypothetical protein
MNSAATWQACEPGAIPAPLYSTTCATTQSHPSPTRMAGNRPQTCNQPTHHHYPPGNAHPSTPTRPNPNGRQAHEIDGNQTPTLNDCRDNSSTRVARTTSVTTRRKYRPLFGELKELADQDRDSPPATINQRRIKAKKFLIMSQGGKHDPTGILANTINRTSEDLSDGFCASKRSGLDRPIAQFDNASAAGTPHDHRAADPTA